MGKQVAERAVVLGGSIGGLLAARVLSEAFTEVTVVDRDELTEAGTGYRRGAPHGRHAHGLQARGQQIFESHFPGLTAELATAGVTSGDFNGDIRWHFNGARLRPGHSGLVCVPATRPFLEHHVRERVRAIPNVTFLDGYDITGLAATPDQRRVTGARVLRRNGGEEETLHADLVVDTTGRGSRTPVWLAEMGYPRPEEERLKIDLAYTTRHYRLRSDPFGGDLAIIPVATPRHPRGGLLYKLPGDGSRVELSLTGVLGDHPPSDPDGFLDYARSLPIPDVFAAIRDAEPLDDPVTHRFPASVWRHYERLSRFPERLLVLGDAVCSFNPVYAQGMTVSALESLVLARHLRGGLPRATAFFRDVAAEIEAPWSLSAGSDLGYPGIEEKSTMRTRLINSYVSRLQRAAVHDSGLTDAFIRVAGLIDPPQALLRPGNLLRVLRHSWRKPTDPVPNPQVETLGEKA